jgi:hypothetical protein
MKNSEILFYIEYSMALRKSLVALDSNRFLPANFFPQLIRQGFSLFLRGASGFSLLFFPSSSFRSLAVNQGAAENGEKIKDRASIAPGDTTGFTLEAKKDRKFFIDQAMRFIFIQTGKKEILALKFLRNLSAYLLKKKKKNTEETLDIKKKGERSSGKVTR